MNRIGKQLIVMCCRHRDMGWVKIVDDMDSQEERWYRKSLMNLKRARRSFHTSNKTPSSKNRHWKTGLSFQDKVQNLFFKVIHSKNLLILKNNLTTSSTNISKEIAFHHLWNQKLTTIEAVDLSSLLKVLQDQPCRLVIQHWDWSMNMNRCHHLMLQFNL